MAPMLVELEAPDPRAWLARAQTGDTEAFGSLCRLHATGLLRHATALCGDPTLAEDLTQDTLIQAWKSLHRYNGRCQFFTWLCAIMVNRHRSIVRKRRFIFFPACCDSCENEITNPLARLADHGARPDEAAQLQEQADSVRKCIQALPRKHQEVVYLRFYVDDSLESIAVALNCSVGTVKSRLFHALEKLRAMKILPSQSCSPIKNFETP